MAPKKKTERAAVGPSLVSVLLPMLVFHQFQDHLEDNQHIALVRITAEWQDDRMHFVKIVPLRI